MKKILKFFREKPEVYNKIRIIYGKTIGFHFFKEWYLKNIGLWNGKKRIKLLDNEKANKIISKKVKSKKPFMMCRYGSNEFRNLFQENEFDVLCSNAGFFPNDKKLLKKFREVYFESSKQIDLLRIWNYKNHFFKKIKWIKNFPNIESFIGIDTGPNNEWVKSLENKGILIIHPFKKTIETQMKKRKKLGILPKFKKMEVIPAVQTIAGNTDPRFKNWFEALNWMKKEIDKKDFDIALIGCGAYGLPLAAYVKSRGKQAIHVGGALQLFFGIGGKRWENNPNLKRNKYWTSPSKEDLIPNYKKVEGGCYW
jgi:hypothetical protein